MSKLLQQRLSPFNFVFSFKDLKNNRDSYVDIFRKSLAFTRRNRKKNNTLSNNRTDCKYITTGNLITIQKVILFSGRFGFIVAVADHLRHRTE